MVTCKFVGQLPNNQILKYYSENKVDCFIHTSEIEGGAPVSIMEAESAGIPIIATDVGGVREMIQNNGILLSSNPTVDEIANAIEIIINSSDKEKEEMKRNSERIWNEKFDAKKNAKKFIEEVVEKIIPHNRSIILITNGYPYVNSEKSFIETELKELLKQYNVTIIPILDESISSEQENNIGENIKKIDGSNIKILPCILKWSVTKNFFRIVKYFFDKRTITEREEIKKINGKRKSIILWESIKYYCKAIVFQK